MVLRMVETDIRTSVSTLVTRTGTGTDCDIRLNLLKRDA